MHQRVNGRYLLYLYVRINVVAPTVPPISKYKIMLLHPPIVSFILDVGWLLVVMYFVRFLWIDFVSSSCLVS